MAQESSGPCSSLAAAAARARAADTAAAAAAAISSSSLGFGVGSQYQQARSTVRPLTHGAFASAAAFSVVSHEGTNGKASFVSGLSAGMLRAMRMASALRSPRHAQSSLMRWCFLPSLQWSWNRSSSGGHRCSDGKRWRYSRTAAARAAITARMARTMHQHGRAALALGWGFDRCQLRPLPPPPFALLAAPPPAR